MFLFLNCFLIFDSNLNWKQFKNQSLFFKSILAIEFDILWMNLMYTRCTENEIDTYLKFGESEKEKF